MITYQNDGLNFLFNLGRMHGSVFPKALLFSFPSALVSAFFVFLVHDLESLDYFQDKESVMNNNAIWGGFSFLVGFLVVFRTSQAYSRFWEGATQTHKMGAEWFDACSSLMAFCKHSDAEQEIILRFQNLLVRLFSMLHAAALGEIEDCGADADLDDTIAFNLDLIDAESIDDSSLQLILECDARVELIFQWIQQLVVLNIKNGVLSIPPPILSRSFQEIATGMVHFHEALKISNVPFPFPYAQTCDCLLVMHWWIVPFVVSQWVTRPWWAGLFSFIQVFTLWTLNLIAVELENPFGSDANDIDGTGMQLSMNNSLRLLLRAESFSMPYCECGPLSQKQLMEKAIRRADISGRVTSFQAVWARLDSSTESTCSSLRGHSTISKASKTSVRSYRAQAMLATAANASRASRASSFATRSIQSNSSAGFHKAGSTLSDDTGQLDGDSWKELPSENQGLWTREVSHSPVMEERRDFADLTQDSVACETLEPPWSQRQAGDGTPPLLDGPRPPPSMNSESNPLCCVPIEPRQSSRIAPTTPLSEDKELPESFTTEEALQLRWNQILISMEDLEASNSAGYTEYTVEPVDQLGDGELCEQWSDIKPPPSTDKPDNTATRQPRVKIHGAPL